MILPEYTINVIYKTKSMLQCEIIFDKVVFVLRGDAKYSTLDVRISIKNGVRRRNVCLLKYLKAIKDFLISNKYIVTYESRMVDLLNIDIVKFVSIEKLKITNDEMEFLKDTFTNLISLHTKKCSIYDKANMGVLTCAYMDYGSDITTLDSYNGFSGRYLNFIDSHIVNDNKRLIHLYSSILEFRNVNINYETFILTLDAPNLRKLNIIRPRNQQLCNNDLLFISGLYNLESIDIDAVINSLDQIKKLERLREIRAISLNDPWEMQKTKKNREKIYNLKKENGASEESLKEYLMYQSMLSYEKYLDLLNRLYVSRLSRTNWENKIYSNDIEKIKEELIEISKMSYSERKKIAREKKEYTLEDSLDGLWFDKIPKPAEEDVLINSRPFQDGGIDYYIRRKRLIVDE